jgi:magnesium transporter
MSTVEEFIDARDLAGLRRWLEETGVLDIADELTRLPAEERAIPFRLLPKDRALAVFEALDPVYQQELLAGLREGRVRQLVEEMQPDDRARLIDEMPAKVALRLLAGLSAAERALTATLLGYPEDSAGRMMSPEVVSVTESMTAEEALAKIRRQGGSAETIYVLPVTDRERRLLGTVELRDLVLAGPTSPVQALMDREPYFARVDDPQEQAARLIAEGGFLALPVVDTEKRLVGLITFDDAMEILEEEETEDISRTGGSEPLGGPYLSVPVIQVARSRVIWLLVLIVAATLTVNVLRVFEETLETVVVLALFIPLLIGTGGNNGAQAATTVIRAMALGEVRFTDLPRVIGREARVGFVLGLVLGALAFVPVTVFFGSQIGLIVMITLLSICTLAAFLGSLLPLVARRLGIDPAVVSAPLITTLVDATGLVVYFVVAGLVLGL